MRSTPQHKNWIAKLLRRVAGSALGLAVVLATVIVATRATQAQTFTVLHTFSPRADGSNPSAGLVGDAAGNLYGTTGLGGNLACNVRAGCGTVFKMNATGEKRVLHSFTQLDGKFPVGGVVRDAAGNLYGTTAGGGELGCNHSPDCGTVFKVDTKGNKTVLYTFTGGADGQFPSGGLLRDSEGNLYGTTQQGGDLTCNAPSGCGTVFELDTAGDKTVLYSFAGLDGNYPAGVLVRDLAGNLYGTTAFGGDFSCNCGTVFKLDPTGTETVLHSFTGGVDGQFPVGSLVRDAAGNLYGATYEGGDPTCNCGTAFKVGTNGNEKVLHTFTGGVNGQTPLAGLARDPAGNLYGTTEFGGDLACNSSGCGTVFKLDMTGAQTVLYRFAGGADGSFPIANLIRDPAGNLYGTASSGGDLRCNHPYGCGIVFKLTP